MDILPLPASASNAEAADPVRTQPDNEFFTGEFTDAKFEEFLDALPGRRANFMNESPREQAHFRARVARLWVLRTSTMPAELKAAVTLADQLQEQLERIVKNYSKAEGRLLLEAAGLLVPNPNGLNCSWGGDHFANAYRFGRRLIRDLEDYSEIVWASLHLLLPEGSEEPLTAPEARAA